MRGQCFGQASRQLKEWSHDYVSPVYGYQHQPISMLIVLAICGTNPMASKYAARQELPTIHQAYIPIQPLLQFPAVIAKGLTVVVSPVCSPMHLQTLLNRLVLRSQ